jgi:hypothetical protein
MIFRIISNIDEEDQKKKKIKKNQRETVKVGDMYGGEISCQRKLTSRPFLQGEPSAERKLLYLI